MLKTIIDKLRLEFHKTRLTKEVHFHLTAEETFFLIELLERQEVDFDWPKMKFPEEPK